MAGWCYAPVSEHLHLARKRTVFLYAIAPIVCTVFLYTVHTWYEFRFIHDLARKRTVSESIYSTVSLYKHDWYTVYRVEMLRSYFNTASSGAQAHRIYCIYCIYCTVYTLLYIHTHHFERVTKIARRPSWMSGENKNAKQNKNAEILKDVKMMMGKLIQESGESYSCSTSIPCGAMCLWSSSVCKLWENLRSTSTPQPSAPRMQSNSERMAGCVKTTKLTKNYAHKTIGFYRQSLPDANRMLAWIWTPRTLWGIL